MKDYENDYPDFRASPHHEHGDERPSNASANPTFYDVIETRLARRGFLMGGMAAIATGVFGSGLTGRAALAQTASPSGLLGFTPVPVSLEDKVDRPRRIQGSGPRPLGHARHRRHARLCPRRRDRRCAGRAGRQPP